MLSYEVNNVQDAAASSFVIEHKIRHF